MGKVAFEFDDQEDLFDIRLVTNRQRIMYALSEINDYVREIYKGYADGIIVVSKDKVLGGIHAEIPEEYKQEHRHFYIDDEEVMRKLESIIDPIRDLLNDYC